MKRREFLTKATSAGIVGALAPAAVLAAASNAVGAPGQAGWSAAPAATSGGAPSRLSKAWFESFLGQTFDIRHGADEPVRATLIAVSAVPGSDRHQQFTVVLHSAGGRQEGGLVEASHPRSGSFALYLSPSAGDGAHLTCQAHFSLLA